MIRLGLIYTPLPNSTWLQVMAPTSALCKPYCCRAPNFNECLRSKWVKTALIHLLEQPKRHSNTEGETVF